VLKNSCVIISLFLITSCNDVDEPKFTWCVMSSFKDMHCFDSDNKETVRPISSGLGFIMVSPDDMGILKDHHKELHIELDTCE